LPPSIGVSRRRHPERKMNIFSDRSLPRVDVFDPDGNQVDDAGGEVADGHRVSWACDSRTAVLASFVTPRRRPCTNGIF
jgi:hypothetical protein